MFYFLKQTILYENEGDPLLVLKIINTHFHLAIIHNFQHFHKPTKSTHFTVPLLSLLFKIVLLTNVDILYNSIRLRIINVL